MILIWNLVFVEYQYFTLEEGGPKTNFMLNLFSLFFVKKYLNNTGEKHIIHLVFFEILHQLPVFCPRGNLYYMLNLEDFSTKSSIFLYLRVLLVRSKILSQG